MPLKNDAVIGLIALLVLFGVCRFLSLQSENRLLTSELSNYSKALRIANSNIDQINSDVDDANGAVDDAQDTIDGSYGDMTDAINNLSDVDAASTVRPPPINQQINY